MVSIVIVRALIIYTVIELLPFDPNKIGLTHLIKLALFFDRHFNACRIQPIHME